jgi:hypothetical protein
MVRFLNSTGGVLSDFRYIEIVRICSELVRLYIGQVQHVPDYYRPDLLPRLY